MICGGFTLSGDPSLHKDGEGFVVKDSFAFWGKQARILPHVGKDSFAISKKKAELPCVGKDIALHFKRKKAFQAFPMWGRICGEDSFAFGGKRKLDSFPIWERIYREGGGRKVPLYVGKDSSTYILGGIKFDSFPM